MRCFALIISMLSLSGCVSLNYPELSVVPTVEEDESLVFFYRQSKFTGSGVRIRIHEGDDYIGALGSGTYFFYRTDPGEHTFWAKTEVIESLTIDLEPNETYYIKGEIKMGAFVGRPRFTIMHPLEGESRVKELKYATPRKTDD